MAKNAGNNGDIASKTELEEMIKRSTMETLNPYIENLDQKEREGELTSFLRENPDFKEYETKIKNYMNHKSRSQLPIKSIAYDVAGADLLTIGAKRREESGKALEKTKIGGNTHERGATQKGVWDMDEKEFRKYKEDLMNNRKD